MSSKPPISKSEAKALLWKSGNLSWKLDKNQLEMREFIFKDHPNTNTVVIASSRRLGKSYAMLVISIELCLKRDNIKINYVAPTAAMLRDYLYPMVEEILGDCPQNIRPDVSVNRNSIKFKNGSEIKLAGTDNKRADKLRGRASDLCIVDEAGFCTDLAYVVDSILQPTTLTTRGKVVLISTPPATMDHPFVEYMNKAQYTSTFIRKTIYDNPRLTPQDIQKMADIVGGVDSNQFRREYLCQLIVATEDVVIPEFTKDLQSQIIREIPPPPHYDAYVSMDIGGKDLTAIIFGYYDFLKSTVVITDELFLKDVTIDSMAFQIRQKEEENFKDKLGLKKEPFLRVADNNNIILLNDLSSKHNLYFTPTLKDNKEAALNNFRVMLKDGRVIIHPRCKILIAHIENATWAKSGKSFTRSTTHSHYDGLDAISYLIRNIVFSHNPYPVGSIDPSQYHIPTYNQVPKITEKPVNIDNGLRALFKVKPKRFFR